MRLAHLTLSIIASTVFILSPPSPAQTQIQIQTGNFQISNDPAKRFSAILDIIDAISTIIPGQGFKSIGLGDSMDRLQQLWGMPISIDKHKRLLYRLDSNTLIQFSGKQTIESIVVSGLAGSTARINNGAVFGMTRGQVLSQFASRPDQTSNNIIQYARLGIELNFTAHKLTKIIIFPPTRP